MLDQIDKIASAANLRPDVARKATALVLSLIKSQGNQNKVDELFAKFEGADVLAVEGAAGGGLLAKMAGGMMGGPLAAISRMQSLGVSLDQSKIVHAMVLDHARKVAGDTLVREVAGNIPGVGGYL